MSRLIGLSLSLCVADIIRGKERESDVSKIIASTWVETPADMDKLMAEYRQTYWSENPDLGEEIARRLFEEGKVEQPRKLTNTHGYIPHPGIANGHWKNRRWAFYFTDGSVYYATGVSADSAYQKVEGVLDDMDEDDECSDEVEILEGTPEWDNFQESFG